MTILEEDRPLALIERWKPDLYIKGGDYSASSLRSSSAVAAYGGESIVISSDFPSISTTAMFERIQALALHETPLPAHSQQRERLVLVGPRWNFGEGRHLRSGGKWNCCPALPSL